MAPMDPPRVSIASASRLLQARLPLIEQLAYVLVAEVEVGQLAGQVHRPGEFAGLGVAAGKLIEDFLAEALVGGREVPEGLLEVPLGEPPVVAALEAEA